MRECLLSSDSAVTCHPSWRDAEPLGDPAAALSYFGGLVAADTEHWRQRARRHLRASGASIADGDCDDAVHDALLAIADRAGRGGPVHAHAGYLCCGLRLIARRRAEAERRAAALSTSLDALAERHAEPPAPDPARADPGSLAALALFESLDLAREMRARIRSGSLRLTVTQHRAMGRCGRLSPAERKARQYGRIKVEAAFRDILAAAVFGPSGRAVPARELTDEAFRRLLERADLFAADVAALVAARARPYRRRAAALGQTSLPAAG